MESVEVAGATSTLEATMDQQEQRLLAAKEEAWRRWNSHPAVSGVGLGDGTVRLYLVDDSLCEELPSELMGVPIEIVVTGDITAYRG